jgi:GNAT superfamily N-acetyltransferase
MKRATHMRIGGNGDHMTDGLTFRYAEETDVSTILFFIKQLAAYEKMLDEVVATEELLREWIFEKKKAEIFFAVADGKEVGFALFFHNFSTFLGRAGIYLEDLFVLPEYRGRGIGRSILRRLAQIAVERGCGRFEWACLDWNRPSIDFYLSLGAEPLQEWTVYRFAGETLRKMAQ